MKPIADLILQNGRITTLDPRHPEAKEVVIVGDKVAGVDNAAEFGRGPQTKVVDLNGRRVIPGLYDSHLHVIRGVLDHNLELRWEGVPSLALALEMLRNRQLELPLRNGCGWWEDGANFNSSSGVCRPWMRSMPPPRKRRSSFCISTAGLCSTGQRLRHVATPRTRRIHPEARLFVIERVIQPVCWWRGLTPLSFIPRWPRGRKLPPEYQYNSTRHFMRELNRLGVTSVCDAGGGFQNYPEDYEIIQQLHQRGEMTIRIAYNLFTQKPGGELGRLRALVEGGKAGPRR